MKKTAVILASPRKAGNSETLALRAMDGISAAGAECEVIRLNDLTIRPCQACGFCKRKPGSRCAIKDNMDAVYDALERADAILIASPIYMFSVTAQLKLFMDRCYAVPEYIKGKNIGVILTYGDTDEYSSGAINAIHTMKDEYRYKQANLIGILHGSADKRGEIAQNEKLMEDVFRLGQALAK